MPFVGLAQDKTRNLDQARIATMPEARLAQQFCSAAAETEKENAPQADVLRGITSCLLLESFQALSCAADLPPRIPLQCISQSDTSTVIPSSQGRHVSFHSSTRSSTPPPCGKPTVFVSPAKEPWAAKEEDTVAQAYADETPVARRARRSLSSTMELATVAPAPQSLSPKALLEGEVKCLAPFFDALEARKEGGGRLSELVIETVFEQTVMSSPNVITFRSETGVPIVVLSPIDLSQLSPRGRHTNAERLKKGRPPCAAGGYSYTLHHLTQSEDGPLIAMTDHTHREQYGSLHHRPRKLGTKINRNRFKVQKQRVWSEVRQCYATKLRKQRVTRASEVGVTGHYDSDDLMEE